MKKKFKAVALAGLVAVLFTCGISAQVPGIISYQGRVQVSGTNFSGNGQFKFALLAPNTNLSRQATATAIVNGGFVTGYTVTDGGVGYTSAPVVTITDSTGSGATATASISGGVVTSVNPVSAGSGYSANPTVHIAPPPGVFDTLWSNDETSSQGSQPTSAVVVPVSAGLFNVLLGDTSVPNMLPIPPTVFTNNQVVLRIWFNNGVNGFAQLNPEQRIGSVGYAMKAGLASGVAFNSVGAEELKNGSISGNKLAPGVIPTSLPPSGTAGGDLTGNYPNPSLAANAVSGGKIANQGVDLTKISQSGALAGEVLNYDGTSVGWRKDSLQLPFTASANSSGTHFELVDTSTNSGVLARLNVQPTNSTKTALSIASAAHGVPAIEASTSGGGSVAFFQKAVDRDTSGGGTFIGPVLVANSTGQSTVTAAEFNIFNTNSSRPVLDLLHQGTGVAIQADATGSNIAIFRRRTVTGPGSATTTTVVRFDSTGKGFFDGGTQTGGADIAEAFDVEGGRAKYNPGDVLVISTSRSRQVALSSEPYSTLVAGVVATKPGVLLTEAGNEEDISSQVPMGVIGVIPTKVTAENGAIRIGDLLVTSSVPGHAMKGEPSVVKDLPGCIIGKALDNFEDNQSGMIRVLVNVR